MPRLTLATTASANPMGAQRYEREIVSRASAWLPDAWDVRHETFRSLRSSLAGTRRLPVGWLAGAGVDSRRALGRFAYGRSPGIVHRMDLVLPPGPGVNVITLHDTVAWRFPDESAPIHAAAEEVRRADAVICVSAFTAEDAVARLGVRDPIVVPNGVDERFFDAVALPTGALASVGISGPYILHMGGASRRKNLEALAESWPIIRRRFPEMTLVLAGPPHPRRTALFGALAGARMIGKVADDLMPGLIASARVVVIPSLYEGFGLPAIEAMAAGTPVVAADTSALSEVVGGAGILASPTPNGIAEAVLSALSDEAATVQLRSAGKVRAAKYSWDRCLAGHLRVWESLAG